MNLIKFFKGKYGWFLNLKPLNKLYVIGAIAGILGFIIAIPPFMNWVENQKKELPPLSPTEPIKEDVNLIELKPRTTIYPYGSNTTELYQVKLKDNSTLIYKLTIEFINDKYEKYFNETFLGNMTNNYTVWYYPNKNVGENKVHAYLDLINSSDIAYEPKENWNSFIILKP
ncbi:MAG: hypothetical protein AABX61_00280 [Nanoarchaeota archaeon]